MKGFDRILWLFFFSVAFLSCSHKEIYCPGGEPRPIEIRFMWDKAQEAGVEGMSLYFFGVDGSRNWRYDVAGMTGGNVELPLGKYRLLTVNNDLPGVVISDTESFSSLQAKCRNSLPTGMLYGAKVDEIEVTLCGVDYTQPDGSVKHCPYNLVRCYPDSLAVVYSLIVEKPKGLGGVRSINAVLSGMGKKLNISSGESLEGGARVSFPLALDADSCLRGATTAFMSPHKESPFDVSVRFIRSDGKEYVKNVDVTSQVSHSFGARNVIIVLKDFEIPEEQPPTSSGDVGIEVGVDGWDKIEIDLSTEIEL